MQLTIYRHIAVAISKKHILTLLQPFDPNIPKDRNGFLHLLAFQTCHTPSIHASAYAFERGYPARLQPELIDRYFDNSFIWHRFLGITEEITINRGLDAGTLYEQVQETVTLTTKRADRTADFGMSDEEPVTVGSGDQEITEARRIERGSLPRSKRQLRIDPCDVHQDQSVSDPAGLTRGGVSSSCGGSGRRYTKGREGYLDGGKRTPAERVKPLNSLSH